MGIMRCYEGVSLIIFPISGVILKDSPLGTMTYLATSSWPLNSTSYGFHLTGQVFDPTRK